MTLEEHIQAVVRQAVADAMREARPQERAKPGLPSYLSIKQAAEVAGVSDETVAGWLTRGELPTHWAGRRRRVRLDELERYLAQGSRGRELSPREREASVTSMVTALKRRGA